MNRDDGVRNRDDGVQDRKIGVRNRDDGIKIWFLSFGVNLYLWDMAKSLNNNLHSAKNAKKDEFYTQLEDIENELKHYKHHFKGKTVFCNCDDPRISNFFHYFSHRFESLGLKKLIATCYKNQDMDLFSTNESEKAIMLEYNGDKNGDKTPNAEEIGIIELEGDGDFRSAESIAFLKEADIVVTNPPFSLFREYVAQLMDYDKKFIIVGHQNAITYKDIFSYIKENKLWLGNGFKGGAAHFINKSYENYATATDKKEGMIRVSGVVWFTNLEIDKRHEDLDLFKEYTPEEYPKYDNYDAININKTKEIPGDYAGVMGVPITFLDKYNPNQFEIIGLGISNSGIEIGVRPYKPEHKKYRKEIQKRGAVDGDLYFVNNGIVDVPYARILIKNKNPKH